MSDASYELSCLAKSPEVSAVLQRDIMEGFNALEKIAILKVTKNNPTVETIKSVSEIHWRRQRGCGPAFIVKLIRRGLLETLPEAAEDNLTTRALNVLHNANIPVTKNAVREALTNRRELRAGKNSVQGLGWKTENELRVWCGLPERQKQYTIHLNLTDLETLKAILTSAKADALLKHIQESTEHEQPMPNLR